jgi:hypothetical protein
MTAIAVRSLTTADIAACSLILYSLPDWFGIGLRTAFPIADAVGT